MKIEEAITKSIKYDTHNTDKLKKALSDLCKEMKELKEVKK